MGNTLATIRGAGENTKRNRKRQIWERVKRNIANSGVSNDEAARLMNLLRSDLEELIEIASVEQYVRGHHDGMQKAEAQFRPAGYEVQE